MVLAAEWAECGGPAPDTRTDCSEGGFGYRQRGAGAQTMSTWLVEVGEGRRARQGGSIPPTASQGLLLGELLV